MSTATRASEFQPRVAPYDPERFKAWHERHGKEPFSKEFNRILAVRMRNPLVDDDSRVLAWVVLQAPGNDSDWAVDGHGNIQGQSQCARDTLLDRRRVSEALMRLEARNEVRLAKDGTRRIFYLDGRRNGEALSETSGQDEAKLFKTFIDNWRLEHPKLATLRDESTARINEERAKTEERIKPELETVKAIDLQILSDWRAARKQKNEGAQNGQSDEDAVSETSGQTVRNGTDKPSETARTNGGATNKKEEVGSKSVSPDAARKTDGLTARPLHEQIRTMLTVLLTPKMDEVPETALCQQVATAIRSVPDGLRRLELKIRTRRWKPGDTMGLVASLARDIRKAHDSGEQLRKESEEKYTRKVEQEYRETVAKIRAQWPTMDEEDRDFIRKNAPDLVPADLAEGAGAA